MPPLTMRGRYLMREYWSDTDLFLRLSAAERETYIGLWMLADDSGWLPRDIPGIAAALYRYDERPTREAKVTADLVRLRELGKLASYRCCIHLPAVERYPRAGQKSDIHAKEHQTHSNRVKGKQPSLTPSPVPSLPNPSLPVVSPAPSPDGGAGAGDEFDDLMARNGFARPKKGAA